MTRSLTVTALTTKMLTWKRLLPLKRIIEGPYAVFAAPTSTTTPKGDIVAPERVMSILISFLTAKEGETLHGGERQKERDRNMTAPEMSEGSGNYLDKETERRSERERATV